MNHVTTETPNQKDRNAITYCFLLLGGGLLVYIYIYMYISYVHHSVYVYNVHIYELEFIHTSTLPAVHCVLRPSAGGVMGSALIHKGPPF